MDKEFRNHIYYFMTRTIGACFFAILFALNLKGLYGELIGQASAEHWLLFSTDLLASIAVVSYYFLVIGIYIFRPDPLKSSKSFTEKLVAFAGSFIVMLFPLVGDSAVSIWQNSMSAILIVCGALLSFIALQNLGKSFSIIPEARKLKTTGAYGIVRHPLYIVETLALVGVAVKFFTWPVLFLLVLQLACQVQRMRYEERLLLKAFPEYKEYQKRVNMIIPKVFS